MANNKSLQFLRGTQSVISSSTEVALAGQPIFATDTNQLYVGDGSTQIKNLKPINTEGSYSTLGAGHLPNNYIYAGGTSDPKWYKIATISNAPNLAAASLLLSINGIFATQDNQYSAETGQIEFDVANASGTYSCSATLNYGNINPNNVCVVQNNSTAELYYHFDSNYQSILVTVMSFYGGSTASYELTDVGVSAAPSNAIYAVNRNTADNAGTLSNKVRISSDTSPGWYKFMEVSDLYISNAYSAILLVNGLLHTNDDTHANSAKSGVIEVDYYNTSNSADDYTVNILCGNLNPNDFYITASGNSIAIYVNLPNNYTNIDIIQFSVYGNGATTSYISEKQSSAPSGGSYAVNRNVAAKGITPATSSNSDEIATTEWVNDKGYVTLTGYQTISGSKTFTGNNIVKANFLRTAGAGNYKYFDYLDTNNNRMGVIGSSTAASSYYGVYMQAGNEGNIGIYSNGSDVYTFAPTPDSSSNTNEIATTEWVNDRLESLGFNEGVITDSPVSSSNTVNLSSYTLKRFGKAVLLESLHTTSSSSSVVRWRGQLSDPAFYPKTTMNISTGYRDYSGNAVILHVYTDGSMYVSYISSGSGGYAGVDNVGWEAA